MRREVESVYGWREMEGEFPNNKRLTVSTVFASPSQGYETGILGAVLRRIILATCLAFFLFCICHFYRES